MKTKLNTVLKTLFVAALIAIVGIGSAVNGHADAVSDIIISHNYTSYPTQYAGALYIKNSSLELIKSKYTPEQVELYLQCAYTGDYYPFRVATGSFKPVFELMPYDVINDGSIIDYEYKAYFVLGPYATIQDYMAWASSQGLDPWGINTNDPCVKIALKQIPKPAQITKAQYLANHGATAAPAASGTAVEALKTYKGNTAEFNAYYYYSNYADLQTALGTNGDALLKHWNEHGKAEGRIANKTK